MDHRLLVAPRTRGTDPRVAAVARALSHGGEHGALWLAAGPAGAAADRPRRPAWLRGTALSCGVHLLSVALKRVVRRPRRLLPGHGGVRGARLWSVRGARTRGVRGRQARSVRGAQVQSMDRTRVQSMSWMRVQSMSPMRVQSMSWTRVESGSWARVQSMTWTPPGSMRWGRS
ncbi:hypothetical protein [Streptomyces chrestomyceticus]|uniref:hypothetical protein n=1 Tax=Streptomyces chrestomyceticus TaxID=68185 RepID=UPI0037AFDCCE